MLADVCPCSSHVKRCCLISDECFPLIVPELGVSTMQRLFRAPLRLQKRMTIPVLVALFSLSSILLAGCGGSSSSGGSSSKITLTILESVGWVHPPEMDLAKQFQAQTGIHIQYQIIPAANYFQVLDTKLNSGQGPDIFGVRAACPTCEVRTTCRRMPSICRTKPG